MEETQNTNIAEITPETASGEETQQEETTVNPVKVALDKVKQNGPKRTELEKAKFTLNSTKKRILELGGTLEDDSAPTEDDSKPLTRGDLRQIEIERAQTTALSLADTIPDVHERELTKAYLENTIRPSGDPQADLALARSLVNSVKNSQISQEVVRGAQSMVTSTGSGSGAPARKEAAFQPTSEEATLMKVWGLTQDQVVEARKKERGE